MPVALLVDLFDTLVLINESIYLDGKAAMAQRLGTALPEFSAAWRATANDAQTGRLPTTAARCAALMTAVGLAPDAGLAIELAALDESHLLKASTLYPGTAEFLSAAGRLTGGRLVLVSNAAANGRLVFRHLGLNAWFRTEIFSFETGVMKPQPEIYALGLAATGVAAASSWFLGDGAGGELEGALAAGLRPLRMDHPEKFTLLRGQPLIDAAIPVCHSYADVLHHLRG